MDNGGLRQLTHQNDKLFAQLDLGAVEDIGFESTDGTEVHGLIDEAGRLPGREDIPRCCAFTAARTGRTSTRSASSGSCSPRNGYVVVR